MIGQTRQRAKAQFRRELPTRRKHLELDVARLDALLTRLGTTDQYAREGAHAELVEIARDHITWRRLRAVRTPRPNARQCFRVIAADAREMISVLGVLPKQTEQLLWRCFDVGVISGLSEPGFKDLQRVGLVLCELRDAASATMFAIQREEPKLRCRLPKLTELRDRADCLGQNVLDGLPVQTSLNLIATPGFACLMPEYDRHRSLRAYVETMLQNFAYLCDLAYEIAGLTRGQQYNTPLLYVVKALAGLWKDVTGRSATHTGHDGCAYAGAPQTAFGKFVLDFILLLEPADEHGRKRIPRGVEETIADICSPERVKAARRKTVAQNAIWFENVEGLLGAKTCRI